MIQQNPEKPRKPSDTLRILIKDYEAILRG